MAQTSCDLCGWSNLMAELLIALDYRKIFVLLNRSLITWIIVRKHVMIRITYGEEHIYRKG